ncbi:hypothetical protein LP52_06660 [Streptomonospora alba]|uniref:Uncharacterized protein n=1 Tax=Streptomonospora alba TaxID=183763 RepID=A0A0C2FJP2_9ACTN|nr:hypothetical protein [Streptomonospora alba]KIH99554.1 hypothetical protein LP52_06660 [Streptomonospora alba]
MTGTSRLARLPGTGTDVLVDGDGTGAVRTPAGRFLRLRFPPPGLLDALAGTAGGEEASSAYADRLTEAMAARERDDAERRWPARRRDVVLLGGGPVLDALAEALGELGADITRHRGGTADEPAPSAVAPDSGIAPEAGPGCRRLVVAFAETPAERAGWAAFDSLPEQGTAWLGGYREGDNCFVDPIRLSADDPTADQVQKRRLAASPVARELAAWQRSASHAPPALPAAARTLLIGRMLTVALAWAQETDELARFRTSLWKYVSASATATEHTVLGYPEPFAPGCEAGA